MKLFAFTLPGTMSDSKDRKAKKKDVFGGEGVPEREKTGRMSRIAKYELIHVNKIETSSFIKSHKSKSKCHVTFFVLLLNPF
jgi:hypothetical protein